jgi:excisionase family DNA binding protein
MNRLINFNDYKVPRSTRKRTNIASSFADILDEAHIEIEVDAAFRITIELLSKNYPNKTLFSLNEAAKQLTVGNEFIRRRIKSGKIKATYLGDKPLINIVELARIITEGV